MSNNHRSKLMPLVMHSSCKCYVMLCYGRIYLMCYFFILYIFGLRQNIWHDDTFQRRQPTRGGSVRPASLQLVFNSSYRRDWRFFHSGVSLHSEAARRWCTSEPRTNSKVPLSGVQQQYHETWHKLPVQTMWWLAALVMFWISKRIATHMIGHAPPASLDGS